MLVSLPSNLAALRLVTAARLKAMYDAIAAAVNGNLARDNFAPAAALSVSNKANPRSWFPLEGSLVHPFVGNGGYGNGTQNNGPSVLRWIIPRGAPAARKGTIKVGAWGAWLGGTNGTSVASGTVKLRHTVAATGVTTDKDTFAIVNGTEVGWLFLQVPAEFEVAEGDILEVQVTGPVTFNGGGTLIKGFGAAVWLRMNHLP